MGALGKGALYRLLSQEEKLRQLVQEDPIITRVDMVLAKALELRASDVHIQPEGSTARIRYRIDGVMHDYEHLPEKEYLAVISRFKLLAHLDIAERRLPQDGKLSVSFIDNHDEPQLRTIDCRLATFPSIHGEKIVLRILDTAAHAIELSALGMSMELQRQIAGISTLPYGFFVVTGPTGSGKTTTLYAMLASMDTRAHNIVTMEDPIEYSMPGIMQSQVNTKIGFTFDNGLRSLLRQDPDVIMIGEMRDVSTMQIALEASLTGHLVVSSLHTSSAVGALTRMLDMGAEPFVLASSLTAVLGQRLVRRLCQACKEPDTLQTQQSQALQPYGDISHVYKSRGCVACNHIGYKGRIGIFELCMINDILRSLMIQKASSAELARVAQATGTTSLMHDGLAKVQQGLISLDELLVAVR